MTPLLARLQGIVVDDERQSLLVDDNANEEDARLAVGRRPRSTELEDELDVMGDRPVIVCTEDVSEAFLARDWRFLNA